MIHGGRALARKLNRLIRRPRIVFLGDSITEFWLDADPVLFLARRWRVSGVSGETTREMRARFDRDVIALRPGAVHIMGGTNDFWHGIPGEGAGAAIANLAAMAGAARARGIAVILAAPPPIAASVEHMFGHAELFPALRAAVAAMCAAEGFVHVDYARSLCDAEDRLVPAFTTDGVHLTRAGYRAMRRQAKAASRSALAGRGTGTPPPR